MGKVRVSVSHEVPPDFIVYDIGMSQFVCKGCQKTESWDLDEEATRGGGPSDKARIKNFLGAHARCVAKRVEDLVARGG